MLGLNSLLKFFRKTFAPKVEGRGFLPRRYYLHRALEALDEDDIDEAVRMITLAGQDKKKSARWRMVCQQVIFRCSVLVSIHEKQMDQINTELEIFGKTKISATFTCGCRRWNARRGTFSRTMNCDYLSN